MLDADLAQGLLAVRLKYAEDFWEAGDTRDCAYPGLEPRQGVRLAVVRAGAWEPVGSWTIYASVKEGEACTTEAEAAAALADAKAGFALHGLDPKGTPRFTPLAVDLFANPLYVTVGGHSVRVEEVEVPSFEALMRHPDLVRDDYAYDEVSRARCFREITSTSRTMCMAWDANCAGRAELRVIGVVEEEGRGVVLYEPLYGSCHGTAPSLLVSPVIGAP